MAVLVTDPYIQPLNPTITNFYLLVSSPREKGRVHYCTGAPARCERLVTSEQIGNLSQHFANDPSRQCVHGNASHHSQFLSTD